MRSFAFIALVLFSSFGALAENRVIPVISEVTVYRSGAKVSSTATVRVPAGQSEVVFENLSPYFNANSLQVRIAGSSTLISAIFQMKTPGPGPESPRAPVLRDSLVLLGDDLTRIRDERDVLNSENSLISNKMNQIGTVLPGASTTITLSVTELRELSTFYRQRLMEIKDRLLQLAIKERKINELYRKIQETLTRLQPNVANQTGEIILKIDAAAAQSVEITCTYLITQAGWTPLYDLRSEGLDKALRLTYKANVRNQSGFDWKDVKLHLSTANPLVNNNRPVLNPVFVDFRPLYVQQGLDKQLNEVNTYNMAQVQTRDLSRARSEDELDDIVFNPAPPESNQDDFITNFDLVKPQNILANGQDNVVTVDEQDIPAEYEYHAVPKLDAAVFLLAKVADYGKYNLLPGTANIFYQDTYIGQTFLNPQTVADTMLISLGRDEQITIKRVQPKDLTERKKVFSSSIRETYTYEIAVKNNKSIPIKLTILDQIPVSKQESIEVTLDEKDGAEYIKDFGKLKWELQIPANQSKRVRFSYSVKYPKDKPVQIVGNSE
ncbi:MAG: DUF4139 domain-containing protein [Lewinellaceae bacterium]|nr:DUF4139 domain-containing protein [Lewinellaceae bacterium]